MAYKHIVFEERQLIEKMYKSGMGISKIAEAIGRPIITVTRELERCPMGEYTAEAAQNDAVTKHKASIMKYTKTQDDNRKKKYKKIIKACLLVNPDATPRQISRATDFPIERVEKYYDAVKHSIIAKE